MRTKLIILVSLAWAGLLDGSSPAWPLPGEAFTEERHFEEFVQPTVSGTPESALFGCIRNDGGRFHEAIDLAPVLPRSNGEATDPVTAIHAGVVAHVNRVAGNSSYGRYVVLEHPGLIPAIYSLYSHLATIPRSLKTGDPVELGDKIGVMGRSAGGYVIPRSRSHLHLEVGLRLSSSFDEWYQRQGYNSPNLHGNFNGMNLLGWDPLDYFTAFRDGRVESVLGYIESMPPAVMVHVRTRRYPEFLERYPSLKLPGCPEEERVGWEVVFSAWGLPLSMKSLREPELKGSRLAGDISVVAVDLSAIEVYACRNILSEKNGKYYMGSGGRHVLELLFKPD